MDNYRSGGLDAADTLITDDFRQCHCRIANRVGNWFQPGLDEVGHPGSNSRDGGPFTYGCRRHKRMRETKDIFGRMFLGGKGVLVHVDYFLMIFI
jgi:hypothetical protein